MSYNHELIPRNIIKGNTDGKYIFLSICVHRSNEMEGIISIMEIEYIYIYILYVTYNNIISSRADTTKHILKGKTNGKYTVQSRVRVEVEKRSQQRSIVVFHQY